MERKLAEEILASLGREAIVFRYFKDRYAFQLLAYAATEGKNLSEMRRGRFRPLLQKPEVRRVLGTRGGRGVDWELLDTYFPPRTEDYVLTFGVWGDEDDDAWYQTSRPGFNVVVQLNFPPAHDRAYRRYIEPDEEGPFVRRSHPINENGRNTLAWSRIDVDPDRGEALIEEIQSDWIRDAESAGRIALDRLVEGEVAPPWWLSYDGCDAAQAYRYVEYVLADHRRMWDQAMLAASLWLLRERLGIRRIYMHTADDGRRLKRIEGRQPPRSLYEQVPRSFCFERVSGAPKFLRDHLARTRGTPRWEFWRLRV